MGTQFEDLEKRVRSIESTLVDWQDWKFITRDNSHKIGVAEGLATVLHNDVLQLKVDVAHIRREVDAASEERHEMHKKLDLILGFLQPGKQ